MNCQNHIISKSHFSILWTINQWKFQRNNWSPRALSKPTQQQKKKKKHMNITSISFCKNPPIYNVLSFLFRWAALLLVLWLKKADFYWGIWCLHPLAFLGWTSSAPSLEYTRQQETPGNSPLCCSLGPPVPGWSAFFLPSFRVSLHSFHI